MKKKILISLLSGMLLFSFVAGNVYATADLEKDLEKVEEKKEETRKQIDVNKATMEEIYEEVQLLDEEINEIERKIAELQEEVDAAEERIRQTEEELKQAEEERKEYKEVLDERIRVMYMFGDKSYLEVLFSADSFGDLISRLDMIRTVMEYDQEMFAKLEEVEQEIADKKEKIEEERKAIVNRQNQERQEKTSLDQVKASRQTYVRELESNTELLEKKENQLEQESAAIENKIQEHIRQQQAEQGGNDTHYGNGVYRWPTPGYGRITSPFGYRIHPIYGYQRMHTGVDISVGGRRGVSTVAVGDARVIYSTYMSGYGNTVILDLGTDSNGNNVTALYGHMASRYVSAGQRISAGTAVGEVGTTGASTGIHLHFEIRINGSPKNPLNYVSP